MDRSLVLFAPILLVAMFAVSGAISPQLNSYLVQYIPSSIIANSTFFNQSVGASSYAVMRISANHYIVINTTGANYQILLNSTSILPVLTAFVNVNYYPNQTTISALNSAMHSFASGSNQTINQCIQLLGLDRQGSSCTLANSCASCQTVPICKKVMNKFGGPSGVFGIGIMNFTNHLTALNINYSLYFSSIAALNQQASTSSSSLATLNSSAYNIKNITLHIQNNPLFPLPQNFNVTLIRGCAGYVNISRAPYYCVDVGYCANLNFNFTKLNNTVSTISNLQSKLGISSVRSLSSVSAQFAQSFVLPELNAVEGMQFAIFANTTGARYRALIANATALQLSVNNATLSSAVAAAQAEYNRIIQLGINQNVSAANITLSAQLAALQAVYTKLNAQRVALASAAQNNTLLIIRKQLDYQVVPGSLATLAAQQQAINARINAGDISSSNSITASLTSIKKQAASYSAPVSAAMLTKAIDGPIISQLIGANVANAQQLSLVYAIGIALIVAILAFIGFYLLYHRPAKAHAKVRRGALKDHGPSDRLAMLIIAVAIIIAYVYVSYSGASTANQFLPFSSFSSAVAASKSVYIAINASGGPSPALSNCASAIKAELARQSKTVNIVNLTGICAINSYCYGQLVSSGSPVIILDNGATSISYKGLYGTILDVSGGPAQGSTCLASKLLASS